MNTVAVPFTMWFVVMAGPVGIVVILIPCIGANQYSWCHRLRHGIRHRLIARRNAELDRGRRRVIEAQKNAALESK